MTRRNSRRSARAPPGSLPSAPALTSAASKLAHAEGRSRAPLVPARLACHRISLRPVPLSSGDNYIDTHRYSAIRGRLLTSFSHFDHRSGSPFGRPLLLGQPGMRTGHSRQGCPRSKTHGDRRVVIVTVESDSGTGV